MAIDTIIDLSDSARVVTEPGVAPIRPETVSQLVLDTTVRWLPAASTGKAVVICPMEDTAFYEHLGWDVAEAPIQCEQPNGRVTLEREVALSLACQGDAEWPSGSIDLGGTPW